MAENKKLISGWYIPSKEKHFEGYLVNNINKNGVGEYQKEQELILLNILITKILQSILEPVLVFGQKIYVKHLIM